MSSLVGLGSSLHGGGSAFLTSPASTSTFGGALGGPLGYGLGAAAGSIAGNAFSSKAVNFRGKYARNQLKHDKNVWAAQEVQRQKNQTWQSAHDIAQISPRQAALMKSMDESGLHRLAALGINPGSGSAASGPSGTSAQPLIPGQSDFGNVVSDGINTALNVAQSDRMFGLKMQEQELRNDWLRTQIANSRMKMLTGTANSTQDEDTRAVFPTQSHPSEGQSRHYRFKDGKEYSVIGGTPMEILEADVGEWANVMPETIHRAYQVFKKQVRNYFGYYDLPKYMEKAPLKHWKEAPNKIVPRERKSWR